MALTKKGSIDRIDIRKPYNEIRMRTKYSIFEDDNEISKVYYHETINPGSLDGSGNWIDTDMSAYTSEIQSISQIVWTDAVKEKYKEFLSVTVSE